MRETGAPNSHSQTRHQVCTVVWVLEWRLSGLKKFWRRKMGVGDQTYSAEEGRQWSMTARGEQASNLKLSATISPSTVSHLRAPLFFFSASWAWGKKLQNISQSFSFPFCFWETISSTTLVESFPTLLDLMNSGVSMDSCDRASWCQTRFCCLSFFQKLLSSPLDFLTSRTILWLQEPDSSLSTRDYYTTSPLDLTKHILVQRWEGLVD